MHEVLVNRLGGLSLSRKSVVRLTDRPDMTLDVYHGRKITKQQHKKTLTENFNLLLILPSPPGPTPVHQVFLYIHKGELKSKSSSFFSLKMAVFGYDALENVTSCYLMAMSLSSVQALPYFFGYMTEFLFFFPSKTIPKV